MYFKFKEGCIGIVFALLLNWLFRVRSAINWKKTGKKGKKNASSSKKNEMKEKTSINKAETVKSVDCTKK